MAVVRADIPGLSQRDGSCLPAWQQYWQQSHRLGTSRRPSAFQAGHIPSWRESCERDALLPVAAACRWPLPLLSPAHRVRTLHPGPGLSAPRPSPPIGLTAADPFAGGEVSRADSRVR
jgi:hypothetical protein